jgi:hypothetical protein
MSFRTYDTARRYICRIGLGAAPFVIAWHYCPRAEEKPLNVDPAHFEQHAYHPIEISPIELRTSASSSSGNLSVNVAEHIRVSDGTVEALRLR